MVVDDVGIINATAGIQNNQTASVCVAEVMAIIPKGNSPAVVEVVFEDGVLASLRRVDGKTQAIQVFISEDDRACSYCVDHCGFAVSEI